MAMNGMRLSLTTLKFVTKKAFIDLKMFFRPMWSVDEAMLTYDVELLNSDSGG